MTHTPRWTLALMTAFLPLSAAAYSPPDIYLYEDDYGLPPPTARHAYDRVLAQNALYAERRQAQGTQRGTTSQPTTAVIPAPPSVAQSVPVPVPADPYHHADAALAEAIDGLTWTVGSLDDTVTNFRADMLRMSRIAGRAQNRAPMGGDDWGWRGAAGPEESMHGGAPLRTYGTSIPSLPHSGPETWLFGGLLAAAGAWTLRRARLQGDAAVA